MNQTPLKRWLSRLLNLAVVVAVCVAVSGTFRNAIAKLEHHEWEMNLPWLVLSGGLYLAAWLPMAWYWWRAMVALKSRPPWFAALYAYFLGHLGKYVPGKVLVLVIRVGLLRRWMASIRLGIASVMLETFTLMAVGSAVGAALVAWVLEMEMQPRVAVLLGVAAIVLALPTLPPLARRLINRLAAHQTIDDATVGMDPVAADTMEHGITLRLLAAGWLASSLCWLLLAGSLWATLRGIGVQELHPTVDLPLLVAAVTLPVVAGFVSMLPGGLIVRDALVMQLLAPICGEADSLVAAVLWRLVSLLSELAVCGILDIVKRSRRTKLDR